MGKFIESILVCCLFAIILGIIIATHLGDIVASLFITHLLVDPPGFRRED